MQNFSMMNHDHNALLEMISDINSSFTNDTSNRATIAERFFVDVFLPMFCGDDPLPWAVTPHMWMNVSNGPFNEVNVVNESNEFLFAVPAIAGQSAIKPLDGTGKDASMMSVSNAIAEANKYANRGGGVVQHLIITELGRRSHMFDVKSMSGDNIERWNTIFKRYNRPLLTMQGTATKQQGVANVDPTRDSTIFDEL